MSPEIVVLAGAPKTKARRRRQVSRGSLPLRPMLNATSRPANRPVVRGRQGDTALDSFNDAQEDRVLHPTKGFRRMNVKRSRAQMLIAEIFSGRRGLTTAKMADFLASD